jgi:nuclear pore complex protein Nup205
MEMVLLLLWRHLVYYAEGHHANNPPANAQASTMHAMRFLSTPEPEAFRLDVAKRLVPTLQRLAAIDLANVRFVLFLLVLTLNSSNPYLGPR